MNSSILNNKQRYAVVVLSVMLSLMVVWAAVQGATTISSNVSTGGTLSVTGNSTLTGTVVLAGGLNASSSATSTFQSGIQLVTGCFRDVSGACLGAATSSSASNTWTVYQLFSGGFLNTASTTFSGQTMFSAPLQASSTLLVTGLSSLTGYVSSASSSVVGPLNVSGPLSASSTLTVNGTSALGGFVSSASSTVASTFNVSGGLNASSTVFATGDFRATSTATTTLALGSGTNRTGSCIELTAVNGGSIRIYATTTPGAVDAPVQTTLRIEAGTCK